jgi:thioredoxin 2
MNAFRCRSCTSINRLGETPTGKQPVCGRCKQSLDISGAPQEVDALAMKSVISNSPVPVLVDFWAPWCPPCRRAAPMLDQLARERAGRVLVLKVNTEEHPEAAAPFGIQSIPTFILFEQGQKVAQQVGLPPADAFARWLDAQIGQGQRQRREAVHG